jgi:hypothetical protein
VVVGRRGVLAAEELAGGVERVFGEARDGTKRGSGDAAGDPQRQRGEGEQVGHVA